jgi:hypothetical protein
MVLVYLTFGDLKYEQLVDLVCFRGCLVGGGELEGAESESKSWSVEEEGGVSEEEAMEE